MATLNFNLLGLDRPGIAQRFMMGQQEAQAEAERNMLRQAQMQQMQQQNTLAAQQLAEYERARREEEGVRNYFAKAQAAGLDATSPDFMKGLYGVSPKAATAYEQTVATRQKATTEEAARRAKLAIDKTTMYRNQVPNLKTREDAARWMQAQVADPDMAGTPVTKVPLMDAVRGIPQDPAEFEQWKQRAGMTFDQFIEYNKPLVVGKALMTRGGQVVGTAPRESKLLTPDELEQQIKLKSAGAARTTLQMPPQPKAEGEARGKLLVKQYENISDAANIARKTIPSIESNLAILNAGFDTGFGTPAKKAGASVLASLGIKDAEKFAANAETFLANATSSILQKQLEQKGPQTESDAKRIEQIGAQLGKTSRGNKFILTVAREQLQRDIEQRNFYDKWWKTNQTYDGAEDAWLAGEGGKSLFDRPAFREFVGATPTPSGAPAGAAPAPAATSPYSSMSNEELLRQLGVTPQGKKK